MTKISILVAFLATCALVAAALLLLSNAAATPVTIHLWLSSVPLGAIGVAYGLMQLRVTPDLKTLAKRLLLAGTFVLWAVVQFLPPGRLATFAGDFVVAAYVIDLYWIIQEQRNS
jgi:hypothetical protein